MSNLVRIGAADAQAAVREFAGEVQAMAEIVGAQWPERVIGAATVVLEACVRHPAWAAALLVEQHFELIVGDVA